MKEANSRTATRTDLSQPAPADAVDESTRQVIDDYSRKFLSFIQQEKDKVRRQAQEESEQVVAEAEGKAAQIYEKAVKDAGVESQRILARCNEHERSLMAEAERLTRVMAEMRLKAQREIDDLRGQLQREANAVAESLRQSDKAIAESTAKMAMEFDDSAAVIARLVRTPVPEAPDPAPVVEPVRPSPASETARNKQSREEASGRTGSKEDASSRKHADKTFVGTINFDIEKGSPAIFGRFREALSKVSGLEISMADDYSKDKARMVAFVNRPMPLLAALHQMSLVKSAVAEKGSIEIVLQDVDRWVG
jgi:protein-tyrosine-phosphatase